MRVVRIKALCRKAGIARLDAGPRGATIQFRGDRYANPAGLVAFLKEQGSAAKLRDNRLILVRDWDAPERRIRGAQSIARELAQRAAA
ncbi:MAG: hypothetical protein KatS3mg118_2299 [Paracoccaceae bacterium]|nr:MAG: hypothetical protein KatS3mg118_2299 [Paracoccaceae bacterium]